MIRGIVLVRESLGSHSPNASPKLIVPSVAPSTSCSIEQLVNNVARLNTRMDIAERTQKQMVGDINANLFFYPMGLQMS